MTRMCGSKWSNLGGWGFLMLAGPLLQLPLHVFVSQAFDVGCGDGGVLPFLPPQPSPVATRPPLASGAPLTC